MSARSPDGSTRGWRPGRPPEPAQEPDSDPLSATPTAGPTQGQTGAGRVAGSSPNGDGEPAGPDAWRRVAGWPNDANRAGRVRSDHDTKARRIAPTPQRIVKPVDDPALGPCVTLRDGKGGSETVAVAALVRRVFGEAAAP